MSGVVSVSRLVRTELEARFGALFNDAVATALAEFGAAEQAFAVNFDGIADQPSNYYREDRTLDLLVETEEPELPALAMWVGEGRNLQFEKPRLFSGDVTMYWRFFLFVKGVRKSGLVAQREAIESALLAVLDPEFGVFGFRGDLSWSNPVEKQIFGVDDQHFGWSQEILFTGSFEVNV
jgi:hypothetical protein